MSKKLIIKVDISDLTDKQAQDMQFEMLVQTEDYPIGLIVVREEICDADSQTKS